MSRREQVAAALPRILARLDRADNFDTIVTDLLTGAVQLAGSNAENARRVASMAAPASVLLEARPWAVGMVTQPGDRVKDPDGRHVYIFTGTTEMTHSNHTFFPGAAGVFHWAIVPEMHEGHRVYPDVPGIIVAVRNGELWWNSDKTRLFRWNAVDNFAVVWPPGAPGVHQWTAV